LAKLALEARVPDPLYAHTVADLEASVRILADRDDLAGAFVAADQGELVGEWL
jgi:hypothetical protein